MKKYRVLKVERKVKSCRNHADGTPYDDLIDTEYILQVLENGGYAVVDTFDSSNKLDSYIGELYWKATSPKVETVINEFEL